MLNSNLNNIKHSLKNKWLYFKWINSGKPSPPPHIVKQKVISHYRRIYQPLIFIETGTYLGDVVQAQLNNFEEIHSIELSEHFYNLAKTKFKRHYHINIHNGDSGKILASVVAKINDKCLFWLDGHYSGGSTAKGDKNCPVIEELNAIAKFPSPKNHIILIDDARLFNGTYDYPTIEEIQIVLNNINPNYKVKVANDIIQCFIH